MNIVPTIKMDGSDYLIVMPKGYFSARIDIAKVFPKAVFDNDRGAFIVKATPESRQLLRQTFPSASWKATTADMLKAQRTRFIKPTSPKKIVADPSASVKQKSGLYKFQEEGVEFLVQRTTAILADDMGLGKTIQVIVTAERILPSGRRLVIVPSTLVENWLDEIEKWTSDEDVALYYIEGGTSATKRAQAIQAVQNDPNCWFVISWEVMRMHATPSAAKTKQRTDNSLTKIPFDIVIADEAHRMKNRKALQSQAIKRIHSERKYALSGTPIMNRPDELWSLLNWLEPSIFTSYWEFFEDYVDYHDGYFGKEIIGAKNIDVLGRMLSSRMIRRTKPEVFSQLPDKTYKNIFVPMSAAQKKAYDELASYLITMLADGEIVTATAVVAKIVRLKQICVSLGLLSDGVTDSTKIDALMELIHDSNGSKIVVFSQFANAIGLVHRRLVKSKIPHVVLTGKHSLLFDGTDRHKVSRGDVVKTFQKDPKYKLYIGTTQIGGIGITLTAANTVIFLDKLWTPSDQRQAEDRLHRIGQKDNVYVISLLTKGTIEEHIERTLRNKQTMIQDIMRAATGTYEPAAKVEGIEVRLQIVDRKGKLNISAVSRLLRRDA